MKKILILSLLMHSPVYADFSGSVTVQGEHYVDDALDSRQLNSDISLSFQPKYTKAWNKGDDVFTLDAFARIGSQDDEKNHADIRELTWLHVDGDYEWRLGINTVFWGVTESQNLVDVINQKDAIEGIDNEKKLGQPMLHLTAINDWGIIDSFVLLGFRERTFAGEEGRPRAPLLIDSDNALYESSEGQQHIDVAIRYSHYYDNIDYAVSLFKGTQRNPSFVLNNGELQPFYAQMTQIGFEAQAIDDAWLWKFEGILVDSDDDYSAITTGFEYSFYGVYESAIDVGTIVEYLYDSRGSDAPTASNRDVFLGARLTFNDIQSSSVLAGMIIDTDNQTRLLRVEVERRLGDEWKLSAEALLYGKTKEDDVLHVFRQDTFLKVELSYYF